MQTATALDILLVDDDGPLREMLTRSFEREGHRVTAVADGDAALAAAGDQPFDVVLLDVALGEGPTGPTVRLPSTTRPWARRRTARMRLRSSASPNGLVT